MKPRPFAAVGALVGHLYPVWLRFRGGKGAATLFGILIALLPIAAAAYAAIWVLMLLTFRISSVAGMSAALSAPLVASVLRSNLFPMLLGFAVLVLWKHRENILRLTRGTEPRIGKSESLIEDLVDRLRLVAHARDWAGYISPVVAPLRHASGRA